MKCEAWENKKLQRQQEKVLNMGRQYGKSTAQMNQFLNGSFYLVSFGDVKMAVEDGKDYKYVRENTHSSVADNIIEDLYFRAKQELWEEKRLIKTNVGRLLYV